MENNIQENQKRKNFFKDILHGFAMGIAFIIPGFSGGSIAAILGIYEKLVGAIADILKNFKKSFFTLLPIAIGLVLGAVSLLYPLSFALEFAPFITVSLFVGLAVGGMPSITENIEGKIDFKGALSLGISLLCAAALSFLPVSADKDLFAIGFWGFVLLFLVGILGSSALVVPGISGSMLLLILGYYNPILNVITEHLLLGRDLGKSVLILICTALGIGVGFISISKLMKMLLAKHKKNTYLAIVGFIVGSIPTVYISTSKDAGLALSSIFTSIPTLAGCIIALCIGFSLSFLLVKKAKKVQ